MEHFQENQNDLKRMEMLRAALPYIPVSMQKFLSIYIGLEELFNAIRIIREGPVLYMDSLNYQPQKLGNTEELVKVLRGFCSPKENELIDMFFQMSNITICTSGGSSDSTSDKSCRHHEYDEAVSGQQ